MTRVLHLLDQAPGHSPALALRLSADAVKWQATHDEHHAWLLVGGEAIRNAARTAGISDTQVCLRPRPYGIRNRMPAATRDLKSVLNRADRVECWTIGAATLASDWGCTHVIPRFGQATLCDYAKRVIETSSGPMGAPAACRPGEKASVASATRRLVRERWGVDDDTIIVALLADHPEQVDAREAWLAIAFTFETLAAAKAKRGDVRLLCHPMTKRRAQADTLAELLGQPQLMMQDPAMLSPWSVLPGCDIALAPAPLSAGLSILWADALGLPVIAPPEPRLALLAKLQHVQTCQSSAAKHLAHPLTRWASDHQPKPVRC